MKCHTIIITICLVLFISGVGWAENATWSVVLTYEAGAERNSLRLIPKPDQPFVPGVIHGATCTILAPDSNGAAQDWLLDIPDDRWSKTLGDGLLIVEFINSPSCRCDSAVYDSNLHADAHLQHPAFRTALESDANLSIMYLEQRDLGNGLLRNVFRLRKAWFGNRSAGSADIRLSVWGSGSFAITRVVVKLRPVAPNVRREPVGFDPFLDALYKRFLKRLPTAIEREVLSQEMCQGKLGLSELFFNMLRSWEFLERTVFPFEDSEGSRRLLGTACGRNPTIRELNEKGLFDATLDPRSQLESIVETYYPEMIEAILRDLDGRKKP